jgi:hypothetical protein
MMLKLSSVAVLSFLGFGSFALAADIGSRTKKPTPPVAVSAACLENVALPPDVFGFTTGSDVSDLGAWGAAVEYNGAYNTRFGQAQNHLAKAQVSTSFFKCLEVGPYVQGNFIRTSVLGLNTNVNTFGGGVEFKYKLLGRDVHGVGLTFVFDPNVNKGNLDSKFFGLKVLDATLTSVNTTSRILLDAKLAPRLFGALNLEHTANWTGDNNYVRSSGLNIRAALSYQLAETFFVGVEGSHQRAYSGNFLNRDLGNAWFVGPTFYWQASKTISLTGAYNVQVAGSARNENFSLNLTNYSQHTAKLKLGVSF